MDLLNAKLPDPAITPHTWHLMKDIQRHVESIQLEGHAEILPDIVCWSGHQLIVGTMQTLLSLGASGMEFQEDFTPDKLYEVLTRGMTDPNVFASFLPSIGRYVLYLWIVRSSVQSGHSDWKIGSVTFGQTESYSFPSLDCCAIELEWFWVNEFILLAAMLAEPELDVIPAFWTGVSREDVVEHPTWQEMRLEALRGRPCLPYTLMLDNSKDGSPVIVAAHQGKDLCARLIILMAFLELSIRRTLEQIIIPVWHKMRASQDLDLNEIDKVLETRMNWQRGMWPDAYLKDPALNITEMRMTFIRDWCEPQERQDMQTRNKAITRLFKKSSGYGPGNVGKVVKEIDPETAALIVDTISDLKKILEVAWPLENIENQKRKARDLILNILGARHMNFRWLEVKPNERLDLCAKIVAEYLEDVTEQRYALASIKKILAENPF